MNVTRAYRIYLKTSVQARFLCNHTTLWFVMKMLIPVVQIAILITLIPMKINILLLLLQL